jgi:acyl-CoA oxidase
VATYKHLNGVTTGDLGPKIGYTSKDSGWARFDSVRIPRNDMFMGITAVDKEGSFEILGDLHVLYTIMMNVRLLIITGVPSMIFQVLQLSVRYNSVRR